MTVDTAEFRRNRGWSQAKLADEIGVSVDVVRHMEKGGQPRGENAVKVAAYFDLTVVEMWSSERSTTPSEPSEAPAV